MNEEELENLAGALIYDRIVLIRQHHLVQASTNLALCVASLSLVYFAWENNQKLMIFVWTASACAAFCSLVLNVHCAWQSHWRAKRILAQGLVGVRMVKGAHEIFRKPN